MTRFLNAFEFAIELLIAVVVFWPFATLAFAACAPFDAARLVRRWARDSRRGGR